jgi:hypothetical protein
MLGGVSQAAAASGPQIEGDQAAPGVVDRQRRLRRSRREVADQVDDETALSALCAEMADDFAHDGIAAYAVAFTGQVTFTGVGLALLVQQPTTCRRCVVIEAHDDHASLVGTRDIVPGDRRLGPLQRHECATGRFGGLLAAR